MKATVFFLILTTSFVAGAQAPIGYENCGAKQQQFLTKSVEQMAYGLSCLKSMASATAKDHLLRLQNKMNPQKPYSLRCSNEPLNSSLASTEVGSGRTEVHAAAFETELSSEKLGEVIFHELFHAIGYGHKQGVDYAYACGECCFAKPQADSRKKDLACFICSNPFNRPDQNFTYLVAIQSLANLSPNGMAISPFQNWVQWMAKNPNSNAALAQLTVALMKSHWRISEAVGVEISQRANALNNKILSTYISQIEDQQKVQTYYVATAAQVASPVTARRVVDEMATALFSCLNGQRPSLRDSLKQLNPYLIYLAEPPLKQVYQGLVHCAQ